MQRIVYLGGLVPKAADSEHLVSRKESGDMLRAGPVPVTEIRAGIIVGPGSAAYEVMRDLVYHLPVMVTPKWVQSRSSPIALPNLLEYLVRVAELPETAGGIYDAGGPEYMSYEEMMLAFGAVVGRRTRIIRVPVLSPRLSSYWLGLVTAVPASIARALIGGLKHDIPARDEALRRLVPQQLLTFRESVVAALRGRARPAGDGRAGPKARFRSAPSGTTTPSTRRRRAAARRRAASPAALWKVVTAIGGDNRYYTMNFLWWLRELLDWLVGGPGFTHGRRHPTDLRIGDAIDYWTVIGMERERRLTLNFGMRAPGAGILEFEIEPLADGQIARDGDRVLAPAGRVGTALLVRAGAGAPVHLRPDDAGDRAARGGDRGRQLAGSASAADPRSLARCDEMPRR